MSTIGKVAFFLLFAFGVQSRSDAPANTPGITARIIDSSFFTNSWQKSFKGSYVAVVQTVFLFRGVITLPEAIYKKLWPEDVDKECGYGRLYCRQKVDIDSRISVDFRAPTTQDLSEIVGRAKMYNYDRPIQMLNNREALHDPVVLNELLIRNDPIQRDYQGSQRDRLIRYGRLHADELEKHMPKVPAGLDLVLVLMSQTDLHTGEFRDSPHLYLVQGFVLDPFSAGGQAFPYNLQALELYDPIDRNSFQVSAESNELIRRLRDDGQIVRVRYDLAQGEQLVDEPQLHQARVQDAASVKRIQSQFTFSMNRVASDFEERVSKIHLVQSPPAGMMLLPQHKTGYRSGDLSALWNATKQAMLDASTGATLYGLTTYINKFYPENYFEENEIVDAHQGNLFIDDLRSFVNKIGQVGNHLTVSFSFKSSPDEAILSMVTGGGQPLPRIASPSFVTDVFRGFYSYQVYLGGYKPIFEELNLIDHDIRKLDCRLIPLQDPRNPYPCYLTARR